MRKILLVLFLFLSCYIIYHLTDKESVFYVSIGNNDQFNNYVINNIDKNIKYNNSYVDENYRISDLVNIIKYNEEKDTSIHYLLNEANILTIYIGMNELYSKLNSDTKDVYKYVNDMIMDMNILLQYISKYDYDNVFVIGYFNTNRDYNDIFTYINYKTRDLVNNYGYTFIDVNGIINENDLLKSDDFKLNSSGFNKIGKLLIDNIN